MSRIITKFWALLLVVLIGNYLAVCQVGRISDHVIVGHSLESYPNLKLMLTIDRTTVSLADDITFNAVLLNTDDHPVYVYNRIGWGGGAGLLLRIQDMNGVAVSSPVMDDTLLPPPPADDISILVRLAAGQLYGARRVSRVQDLVEKPGQYKFSVMYSSVLYRAALKKDLQNLDVLWEGHTPFISSTVIVDVKP